MQLCALRNRAWLLGNVCSKGTCCSGRQVLWKWPCWFPPALPFPTIYCMVSLCCLRTRTPDFTCLQKPLCCSSLSLHVWDIPRACRTLSLWRTQTQTKHHAHTKQVGEISSVCSGSQRCQTHAAVPWELELAVAFDLSQSVMFPLPARKCC